MRKSSSSCNVAVCLCIVPARTDCRCGLPRCREAQAELVERIQVAVALPVRTSIKDVYDDTCTELLVTSQLDSGAPKTQSAGACSGALAPHAQATFHGLPAAQPLAGSGRLALACLAASTCVPNTTQWVPGKPASGQDLLRLEPLPLLAGGRGRPRVTYDVTAALNAARLCVFMADIYVEPEEEAGPAGRRPQELHRFLVHTSDGSRLASAAEKR